VTQLSLSPGSDHYPTTHWQAGQVVRSQVLAHIPGRAQSGQHYWRVTLLDGNGTQVGQAMLGRLQITTPQRVFSTPVISNHVNVRLGDWVALAGFDAPGGITAGQTVSVTLLWQALGETDRDYKVFVHLLSADGRLVAQSDAVPVGWTRPTSGWLAGEFVTDVHALQIKPDVPPGEYKLMAGMYDSADGKRLWAVDGGDTVSLGVIQVTAR
jgi:hypothetical protein